MSMPKSEVRAVNDRVRLQVDMSKDRLESIDKLVNIAGMATRKELLDNALTLIAWAIRETRSGNVIASLNRSDGSYREVAMPCLHVDLENEISKR